MSNFITSILFAKSIKKHEHQLQKLYSQIATLRDENKELFDKIQEVLLDIECPKHILAKNSTTHTLLGIEQDKKGNNVFVFINDKSLFKKYYSVGDNFIDIECYVSDKKAYNNSYRVLHLMAKYITEKGIFDLYKIKELFIDDIQVGGNNISLGYGSMAMKYLFIIAELKAVEKITGKICQSDWESHFDRLVHFYEKNGFSVILNNNTKTGKIEKQIVKSVN